LDGQAGGEDFERGEDEGGEELEDEEEDKENGRSGCALGKGDAGYQPVRSKTFSP